MIKQLLLVLFSLSIIVTMPIDAKADREEDAANALIDILATIQKKGKTPDNIKALDKFTAKHTKTNAGQEAHFVLSDIYTELNDFNSCVKTYKNFFKRYKKSVNRPKAFYGLGYCQYRDGYLREAKQNIEYALAGKTASIEVRVKSTLLLETIESVLASEGEGSTITIGAALPLDGKFEQFGQRALKGILLAADTFETSTKNKVTIAIESTTKEDSRPGQAVLDLAKDKNLKGIIGPLLKDNADEASTVAQRISVPMIAITQKEGITKRGEFVYRNFMTPESQAQTLADLAEKLYFHPRALIMYPQSGYGMELASLFKKELTSRGGEVVGELSYKIGERDFSEEIKELFKIDVEETRVGRRWVSEYKYGVEADIIFIPDYHTAVAQIVPHMAYYKIKDIQLMGTNSWNSPKLMRLAGKYLEGAIFTDAFSSVSKQKGTVDFVTKFKEVYGYTPGIIEAHAYDSTAILLDSIEKATADEETTEENKAIVKALQSTNKPNGATGVVSFNKMREPAGNLFLLTVQNRKVRELDSKEIVLRRNEAAYKKMMEQKAKQQTGNSQSGN